MTLREMLEAHLVGPEFIICERCVQAYPARLPACPYCAVNSREDSRHEITTNT